MRAFARRPGDGPKQELNQSPLSFIESPYQSDAQQALARKDAIIRVRNAQVRSFVLRVCGLCVKGLSITVNAAGALM